MFGRVPDRLLGQPTHTVYGQVWVEQSQYPVVSVVGTGVSCLTLYPGPVLTEIVNVFKDTDARMQKIFLKAETPEFSGKAVASLAADTNIELKSGKICISADLATEYGFTKNDGSLPPSFRQLNLALRLAGFSRTASVIPDWVKLPSVLIHARGSKF